MMIWFGHSCVNLWYPDAAYTLCIGHSATYQLQDKMIPQVMNRQRVCCTSGADREHDTVAYRLHHRP